MQKQMQDIKREFLLTISQINEKTISSSQLHAEHLQLIQKYNEIKEHNFLLVNDKERSQSQNSSQISQLLEQNKEQMEGLVGQIRDLQ